MLKVNKKVIGELEKCYSLALLNYQGKDHFLIAAEKCSPCYLYDLAGNREETVWEGPGGVMTMIQVPKGPKTPDGQFLATRKFYSPNNGKGASIVIVTPKEKNNPTRSRSVSDSQDAEASAPCLWEVRTLCDLPFVHRFGILKGGDKYYLIACALKSDHEYKNDWRFPGKVFVAELPEDLSSFNDVDQLQMTMLKNGMLKNHGYYLHDDGGGNTSAVVSCDNGVFQFVPPQQEGGEWEVRTLTEDAASDGLLLDLNGDGEEELCTIAPFHGDTVNIYQKKDGKFVLDYTYPEKLDFLHAIFGGEVCGKPTWILGNRKENRDLLAFTYEDGKYQAQKLDEGRGAANVLHYVYEGKDILIGANRETDEIAYYELTK